MAAQSAPAAQAKFKPASIACSLASLLTTHQVASTIERGALLGILVVHRRNSSATTTVDGGAAISAVFSFTFWFFLRCAFSLREKDRERAQARTGGKGKNKDDGLTPEQRRERDGKALQEKAAKKAAQAAGGADAGSKSNKK
ncbi:Hypothetical predicted protein [Olea europaea subsp. europaea]|uniref:Small EDRK-rich factor-like N-terminal domain-containing protein n=1 Tax=Olea europaea subsp. europaea TaxID=158383 RepID=A0A8S0VEB7_OLEEU|nr:Hypothetical predicted protein [Olea europaea subsp. europaea]